MRSIGKPESTLYVRGNGDAWASRTHIGGEQLMPAGTQHASVFIMKIFLPAALGMTAVRKTQIRRW
jgi:hypothetical protein